MLLHYLFILGICVESMTGALAAGRKKMDFFGVLVIANITALGGGTVRDALFNTYPLTWVTHPEYLLYTSVSALIAILIAPYLVKAKKIFLILDAVGLSAFVVIGTQKILSHGMPASIAVVAGMTTGICGGMLRDILCNDIPLVLRKELYAIIALAGAILYLSLLNLQIPKNTSIIIALLGIFISRLLAILFHLKVPIFDYSEKK
jgi:uncharacterized membrane protein YeiH